MLARRSLCARPPRGPRSVRAPAGRTRGSRAPSRPCPFLSGPRGPAEPRAGRGGEAAGPGRAAPPAPPQHCRHRGRGGGGPGRCHPARCPRRSERRSAGPERSAPLLPGAHRAFLAPLPAPPPPPPLAHRAGRRSFPRLHASPPAPLRSPRPPAAPRLTPARGRSPALLENRERSWESGASPPAALYRAGRCQSPRRTSAGRAPSRRGRRAEWGSGSARPAQRRAEPSRPRADPQLVGDFFRPLLVRRSKRTALLSSPETSLESNPSALPPVQRLDFLFQCGPTLLKPHTSAPGGALGAHPTPRNEGPPRNTHVPQQQHGRNGIKKSIVKKHSKRGFRIRGASMPEHVWVPSQRAGDAALKPSLRPALPSPSSALQKTFFTLKLRIKLWSTSCVSHTST